MGMKRYRAEDLHRFAKAVLTSLKVPAGDAETVSDSLIRSDLAGIDSHGISRLTIYAKRVREGRIAARPDIRIARSGAVLRVDGGNGLGQVVAMRSLEAAVSVAGQSGLAGIAIRRSNHYGAASYFCEWACRKNLALMALTNSPPGIPPHGGKRAFNQSCRLRRPARPSLIVDMSSSVVARAKSRRPASTHPARLSTGRAERPPIRRRRSGGVLVGGVKGYASPRGGGAVRVLSGAAWPHETSTKKGAAADGYFFILMDISDGCRSIRIFGGWNNVS